MQPAKKFTIGRDRGCDVPIADESVSRVHAELSVVDGKLHLNDCNSRNGTWIVRQGQSRQIQQDYVLPTDQIQLGQVTLPVSDVVDALRRKFPDAFPSERAAPQPNARPQPKPPAPAAPRLMRCACGFIKPSTERCPECGQ